jgi:hypothetical protein
MNPESAPPPAPEDLARGQLAARNATPTLAAHGQNAKWSVSGLLGLLQLRNQLPEERPRRITLRWVDNPRDIGNNDDNDDHHK